MEALLAGVKVCCEDGQCGCEPLSFLTQKKLTSKQARWQELLAEFDFVLEYRAGRTNQVADALSRKAELAALKVMAHLTSSQVATNMRERIRQGLGGAGEKDSSIDATAFTRMGTSGQKETLDEPGEEPLDARDRFNRRFRR